MTIEAFRLSPQQERAWAAQGEEAAARASFHASVRLELAGALEPAHLEAALAKLVAKHEILRSAFALHAKSGRGAQFLHEAASVDLAVHELASDDELAAFEQHAAARLTGAPGAGTPERAPRLVATLARLPGDRAWLWLSLPAEAADRRGLDNLVAELARALADDPAFAEEPMQYADVADWQIELLEAEESRPGLEHWRALELGPGLELAIPFQQDAPRVYAPRTVRRRLGPDDAQRLVATARSIGVEPAHVLLTAWGTLLARLGRQPDVLLGLGLEGRRLEELRDAIGPLQRQVPVTLHLERASTFREAALATAKAVAEAERWLECFAWEQRADAPAFLPFAFEHHAAPEPRRAGALTLTPRVLAVRAERSLCRLESVLGTDELELALDHDPGALPATTANRLAGQLEALLADALADPERPIGRLDVLSAEERQALLVDFNDTAAPYDEERCAHRWIEEQADRTPDAVAVRYQDTSLTYGELERRANRLAHHLMERGVGPDTLVALCIERSVDMVVAIVAILKAGGAYVPVDPAYPRDRIEFLLEDTNAPVVVTQSKLADHFAEGHTNLVFVDTEAEAIAQHPDTRPASGVEPDHLVYVIYTSGSTGKPKGVVITHRKLVISNTARVNAFGHTPECFLLLSSFAFDSSVVGIFWTLCAGGTLLLIPEALQKDIGEIPRIVQRERVSHLLTLPSFYQHLVEQASAEELGGMRAAIVAGEACPLGMVEKHRSRLPGVGLFSEYGATETTVFSSVYDCLPQTLPVASLGTPIDNAQMFILDEELQPCPTGVPGEVHFGGIALAVGYLNRPELTAERFPPHPLTGVPGSELEGARVYKSGDLARWLECGEMEFLGRLDNQVKIRGFRIELEEIEIALALHPGIKESAVLALTDLSAEKRLVGYVVPEARGQAPSVSEMRTFLGESLPDYMVPGVFVVLDDFPRTPNGKVDRKALPEPGGERPELASAFEAAASPVEERLASIWCDVLGLDQVGVNDNFFELGGDSILSIQIVARAKQAGIALTPRLVFENQTIAGLAAAAEVDPETLDAGAVETTAEQGPVTGPVPLTPVEHWFVGLGLPNPSHWNMPVVLRPRRPVDAAHLERSLAALAVHHDALRLRLRRDADGSWQQAIAAPDDSAQATLVQRESVAGLDAAAREALVAKHQQAIDVEHGPLTRVVILEDADGGQELLWILHHLASDGVSWRVLAEDLETLLDQLERGEEPRLGPKTTSYRAWAEGLVAHAAKPEREDELERWRPLAGLTPTPLPTDRAAGDGPTTGRESSARRVTLRFDGMRTQRLLSEVPRTAQVQIQEVLLAAVVQALGRWTGADDVLLNLEGHGRDEILPGVDLSRTVGWFTTDVPVSVGVTDDPAGALLEAKEATRTTAEHALEFGVLRHLAPDAAIRETMAAIPAPETGFNYLGQIDAGVDPSARLRFSDELPPAGHDPTGPRAFLLEIYGMVAGGELTLHFEYSEERHERATIEALAKEFEAALERLVEHALSADAGAATAVAAAADFDWSASDLEAIAGAIQEAQAGEEEG